MSVRSAQGALRQGALRRGALRRGALRQGVRRSLAFAALALVLAACAYRGGATDIVTQRATWFSYLDGDDIRAQCVEGAPDRYRLVYNADYQRQVRTYDVTVLPGGAGEVRASIQRGLTFGGSVDPLEVFSRPSSTIPLGPADTTALVASLNESGAFGPPEAGLRLNSRTPYWLVVSCRNGVYALNGWSYPSPRFEAQTFERVVRSWPGAETGWPALPAPDEAIARNRCPPDRLTESGDNQHVCFDITIGQDGLAGPYLDL